MFMRFHSETTSVKEVGMLCDARGMANVYLLHIIQVL